MIVPRLRSTRAFVVAAVVVIASLTTSYAITANTAAYAIDYPSWDDVQTAKGNEAAKAAEVTRIEGVLAQLQGEVASTAAEAEAKGAAFGDAQQKFDLADQEAQALEKQAAESKTKAEAASQLAGRLAAQLYRSGGSDLTTSLLLDKSTDADALLSKLGNMSKLVERSTAIYDAARTAQNEAASFAKQAEVARTAREALRVEAQKALDAAVQAQNAAQAKLAESQKQSATLNAQLAALKDTTAKTVAQYEAGVAEAARLAEIARQEAERAAAAAAAAAAARAAQEAAARGVSVTDAGWTNPVPNAYVSDVWGPRPNFYIPGVGYTGSFHNATDMAAPCGSPIYAASGGTVTYAGPASGYGYLVVINHGGGISTAYGHILAGSINVYNGQSVGVGQQVAQVGRTGLATGCHTHFEVRTGQWSTIDPQPFMADRGVTLG
jgi:murein DD-endopeptidase MepM/ murein hydrolase activator NlpD